MMPTRSISPTTPAKTECFSESVGESGFSDSKTKYSVIFYLNC